MPAAKSKEDEDEEAAVVPQQVKGKWADTIGSRDFHMSPRYKPPFHVVRREVVMRTCAQAKN